MKSTSKLIICSFTLLAMTASAYAQSPRDELKQMAEQLQKTPTDNSLREKIIKLAATLQPAPAMPDSAIEFEGRARFAFGHAKSEDDFLKAAHEYEKAIAVAPWELGYYSDLCTIYEKANKFEAAKRNCEFWLIGLSDPAQITDAKRRIAGLKYGMEQNSAAAVAEREKKRNEEALANSQRAEQQARERFLKGLDGGIWRFDDRVTYIFYEVRGREIELRYLGKPGNDLRFSYGKSPFNGREFWLSEDLAEKAYGSGAKVKLIISEDAQTITEEAYQERHSCSPCRSVYRRIN